MMFYFISLFIISSLNLAWANPTENPCDKNLQEPAVPVIPTIIEELRNLKLESFDKNLDRAMALLLKKQFDRKTLEIAQKLGISKEELLTKLSQSPTSNKTLSKKTDLQILQMLNEIIAELKKNYPNYTSPFSSDELTHLFVTAIVQNNLATARAVMKLTELDKTITLKIENNLLVIYIERAAHTINLEMLRFLVEEFKADIFEEDNQAKNIIHKIVFANLNTRNNREALLPKFLEIYNYFFKLNPYLFAEERFYLDIEDPDYVISPLHFMHEEEIKWAIANGIEVDTRDYEGRTLLYNAVAALNAGMVEILLNAGANIHSATRSGNTPLKVIEKLMKQHISTPPELLKIQTLFDMHRN